MVVVVVTALALVSSVAVSRQGVHARYDVAFAVLVVSRRHEVVAQRTYLVGRGRREQPWECH